MKTDGINNIAVITGYKYLIFSFEKQPINTDSIRVDIRIKNTIAIASVGPANRGDI